MTAQPTEPPGIFSASSLILESLPGGKTFFPYRFIEPGRLLLSEVDLSKDYLTFVESSRRAYRPGLTTVTGFHFLLRSKPAATGFAQSSSDLLQRPEKWGV